MADVQEQEIKGLVAKLSHGGDTAAIITKCASYGSAALPHLLEALPTTKSGDIAKVLGMLRDPSAVEPLVRSFLERSDGTSSKGWVGSAAAEALGEIGDGRAIPTLLNALKTMDERRYSLQDVAEALGKLGAVDALPYLQEIEKRGGNSGYSPYITTHAGRKASKAIQEIRRRSTPRHQYVTQRTKRACSPPTIGRRRSS